MPLARCEDSVNHTSVSVVLCGVRFRLNSASRWSRDDRLSGGQRATTFEQFGRPNEDGAR